PSFTLLFCNILFPPLASLSDLLPFPTRRSSDLLVPSGGRTGLSGGAVAANGELVVSLERMNRAIAFDPVDRTLTVQAGMVLEARSEEHTSELQSRENLVCRLLLEKKKQKRSDRT